MKSGSIIFALFALVSSINALALPGFSHLFKRKGGGGGGRGGGSIGSSGGRSGSSSGSSGEGGGASGASGSSGSGGRTGGSSSSGSTSGGGRSVSGTTASPRSFGGGRYYGGGATTPFTAGPGRRSPGGISPALFVAPALFAGVAGGLWLHSVYSYPYPHDYSFRNTSAGSNSTGNTTLPVDCLCQEYSQCGCDAPADNSTLDAIVGNGTITNRTLAQVANVNGTQTLLINGTLANATDKGTTTSDGMPSARLAGSMQWAGWATIMAGVAYTVWFF